jgi:hypothetical protein
MAIYDDIVYYSSDPTKFLPWSSPPVSISPLFLDELCWYDPISMVQTDDCPPSLVSTLVTVIFSGTLLVSFCRFSLSSLSSQIEGKIIYKLQ